MEQIAKRFEEEIKAMVSGYQLVDDDDPIEIAGTEAAAKACAEIHSQSQKDLLRWFYAKLSIPISEETLDKMYDLFVTQDK